MALQRRLSTRVQRIRRWVGVHNNLLATIGALLVFGTFVCKDELREKWKALDEQIDRAQTTRIIRNDLLDVRNEITRLERRTGEGYNVMLKIQDHFGEGQRQPVQPFVRTEEESLFHFVDGMVSLLELDRDMLESIPKKERQKEQENIDSLRARAYELRKCAPLLIWSSDAWSSCSGSQFVSDLENAEMEVRDQVRTARDSAKRLSDGFAALSFVLYTGGSFLAIGARLLGVKGVAEPE